MSTIKTNFLTHLKVDVTPMMCKALDTLVLRFELRDEVPMTLNSQMFGVNKFFFTTEDRKLFFEIIGLDEKDVVQVVKNITSIDSAFRVISDAFNLMSIYLVHLLEESKLPKEIIFKTSVNVLNYMQYRFMSSAINHYFPHKANYEIMQTVVESLNLKFAVKQLGTWKAVVADRSTAIVTEDNLHQGTIKKFDKDRDILYLITDISTRIRSQLKIITAEYYAIRETNVFIRSHSATTEMDGEKILREKESSFELTSSILYHKLLNKGAFIDDHVITMVQKTVPRLNTSIIRRALITLSDEANQQLASKTTSKIINKRDGTEVYVGIEVLMHKIIHTIYMSAIRSPRVNINNKLSIYANTKNIVTASRTTDEELVAIKASLTDFVRRTRITQRDSTISGLVVAIVLYLTLQSFKSK